MIGGQLKTERYGLRTLFTFGQYKGISLKKVIHANADYVKWCLEINRITLTKGATEYLDTYGEPDDDDIGFMFGFWEF